MNNGDICSCNHLDSNHVENHLTGILGACKSCSCKWFEWSSTSDVEWSADDLSPFSLHDSDESEGLTC